MTYTERFETTRPRIDHEKTNLTASLSVLPKPMRVMLLVSTSDLCAAEISAAVNRFPEPGSPTELRNAMITLQAIRELLDDIASDELPSE